MQNLIGILGGTFDPIHYGHLRLGQEMLNIYHLNRVHFIPCYKPVHREEPSVSAAKRFAMLQMAIKNQPLFIADDREIKRKTASYTLDTLLSLRHEMQDATLCLLIGSDAFSYYPTWHEPRKILELAHIIVAHRPNYQLPVSSSLQAFLDEYQADNAITIHQKKSGHIFLQPITALDISAQLIRQQIETQENPKYLLPDDVCDYIKINQLYLTK